jgi:AbrB family looped-hinge helix DNA binding protein
MALMAVSGHLTTTISTKSQVILPKTIRDQKHWGTGTRLIVEDMEDGVMLKVAPVFPPARPEDVFGSLRYQGKPKTPEEMNAGILAEAKRRHARNRY